MQYLLMYIEIHIVIVDGITQSTRIKINSGRHYLYIYLSHPHIISFHSPFPYIRVDIKINYHNNTCLSLNILLNVNPWLLFYWRRKMKDWFSFLIGMCEYKQRLCSDLRLCSEIKIASGYLELYYILSSLFVIDLKTCSCFLSNQNQWPNAK